jgi:hypothetical protein
MFIGTAVRISHFALTILLPRSSDVQHEITLLLRLPPSASVFLRLNSKDSTFNYLDNCKVCGKCNWLKQCAVQEQFFSDCLPRVLEQRGCKSTVPSQILWEKLNIRLKRLVRRHAHSLKAYELNHFNFKYWRNAAIRAGCVLASTDNLVHWLQHNY